MERPSFIGRGEDLEVADGPSYEDRDERFGIGAPIGRALGLTRLGVHHVRLPPGRRTSLPHAQSDEEEFVYVLEGEPGAWVDGEVYGLRPGDAVAFPAGTGIAHTFMNDTDSEVRLLVVGEGRNRPDDRVVYPLNPERREEIGDLWWEEAPGRPLGPHGGRPTPRRAPDGDVPGGGTA